MARLTISSALQPAVKLILIIGGSRVELVLEIGGVTRTSRVYQPKDLTDPKENKRKGKEVLVGEPQRKKQVSKDETA